VGRTALDDTAQRLIEAANPGVEFDWPRILKGQGAPPAETRPPVEARRGRPENRRQQPPQSRPNVRPPVPGPRSAEPHPEIVKIGDAVESEGSPDPADPSIGMQEGQAEVVPAVAETSADAGAVAFASSADPRSSSENVPEDVPEYVHEYVDVVIPAHDKIGSDGVRRLRTRYADILTRIPERTADPVRQEELKQLAARLNPDAWLTDEEVAQGLEQYESVFASLREVVGQKRRRRRRGRGQRSSDPTDSSSAVVSSAGDSPEVEAADDDGDESE
jgi:hypothetical protein